jgi:DCN1-like protein 1/2
LDDDDIDSNAIPSSSYHCHCHCHCQLFLSFLSIVCVVVQHRRQAARGREEANKLFAEYSGSHGEAVSGEELVRFFQSIGVEDPVGFEAAYVLYLFGTPDTSIPKSEFVKAWVDNSLSVRALRGKVRSCREYLVDYREFKPFYQFTFLLLTGKLKSIPKEVAPVAFRMILGDRYSYLDRWLQFIDEEAQPDSVTQDVWNMLLEFVDRYPDSVAGYDEEAAWPTLIDEYVEWWNEHDFG